MPIARRLLLATLSLSAHAQTGPFTAAQSAVGLAQRNQAQPTTRPLIHRSTMKSRMPRSLATFLLLAALASAQPPSELDFTAALGELRDLPQATTQSLIAESNRYLANRPTFASPAQVQARAALVRQQILASIGGLPAKTPLNARTVATLDRGKYRIEKVIFESQPRFYVTANLYIPNGAPGPYPAILFPLGHENGAKAHDAWQYVLGSFASKGFVALARTPSARANAISSGTPTSAPPSSFSPPPNTPSSASKPSSPATTWPAI
ncbi:MAG: hypothetical protein NTX13_04180 [Acidobacteria bacterium]|nr:hypothetical protein [Acidobacteriota bacterium]